MTNPLTRTACHLKVGAAALLAAGLLAGSVAPSAAASWLHDQGVSDEARPRTAFHRHFWRGSQLSQTRAPRANMMALAEESTPVDAEMSYCASRFRSYDPSTGTYLGYDGNEHPCP